MTDRVASPRLVLVLTENWTLVDPRDLGDLVRMAVEAEDAGIDTVMLSEHVVLGPDAGANGVMANPREYAMPGNQDPAMPWPDSLVLASAIAAATTRLRIALAAVIAPLRHPLLLAKQLATLDLLSGGRLVVQPTVSWHEEEYGALGVPFRERGARLDDHLDAWRRLWQHGPVSFHGRHADFENVYLEPKPFRPDGPRIWIGGGAAHPSIVRRLLTHGHGFHPLGQPSDDELAGLRRAFEAHGRRLDELELVGGIRGEFPDEHSVAPLEPALQTIPQQMARGFTSICFKPSQFVDDRAKVPDLCREVLRRVERLVG